MKQGKDKADLFVKKGTEVTLPEGALKELLIAVLEKDVPFRFLAKGFSMSPFIKDGDIVTVSPLSIRSIKIGDVVAFIHPNTEHLAVHRVVDKAEEEYFIQGDNIQVADGIIPKVNIVGILSKVERHGKEISLGLGPERKLIALFSRIGILKRFVNLLWRCFHPFISLIKRSHHTKSELQQKDEID